MSRTTVHFACNRRLTGAPDQVGSYGLEIQPPSDPTGIIYGTAFVEGTELARDEPGRIEQIVETQAGSFPPGALADLSTPGRNLLVFVHGFANTFEDAITRAAFNRGFLAASGNPATDTTVIAFSWPSSGKVFSLPVPGAKYRGDQSMARLSGLHLMSMLANLEPILTSARKAGCRSYLLAHSMGNLALQSATENWFLHGNGQATLFDAAILAAGDCGFDALAQPNLAELGGLPQLSERIAVYYSGHDHVLKLSNVLNGQQRLGQDGPRDRTDAAVFPTATFTMYDASGAEDYDRDFMTSHQYYRLSPSVRQRVAIDMVS